MKCLLIIFLFVFHAGCSYGQSLNFSWVRQLGGPSADGGLCVKTDASGNVYTTGTFRGIIDADPGPNVLNLFSSATQDVYIVKLGPAGNLIWARQFGGIGTGPNVIGYSLSLDGVGNIIITGNFDGMIDFDPGPNQFNLLASNGSTWREVFICKLDNAGGFIWAKQFGGLNSRGMLASSVCVDPQNNIITTGFFTGTADFDPGPGTYNLNGAGISSYAFISKLDPSGNFVWAKAIGDISAQCFAFSVALNGSGNILVTGGFGGNGNVPGTIDFDPGPGVANLISTSFTTDAFILKLDAAGNYMWATILNVGINNMSRSVVCDVAGNNYVTGYYTQNNSDVFICKFDNNGNFLWTDKFSGSGYEEGHSITLDASGEIYATGFFEGVVDFDPGAGVYNLSASGPSDVYIIKLDPAGNLLSAKQITGPGTEAAYSVAADNQGNVYTTGFFNDTTDFDPGVNIYNLIPFGGADAFIQKLIKCSNTSTSSITISACKPYTLNSQLYIASGTYTQTLINAAGCDSILTLNLNILPVVSTTIVKTICAGASFDGYNRAGIYKDTFVSSNGCDSIRTLNLNVRPKAFADLGPDRSICGNDSVVLNAGVFQSYLWQDGTTQNQIVVKKPGLYSVTVQDSCGGSRDEVLIKQINCDVYFPSGFTPNNDGKNDQFKVLTNYKLSDYHLAIYNRWGERIFETKDYTKGWDGKKSGILIDGGVFAWICEYKLPGKPEMVSVKGVISLIR